MQHVKEKIGKVVNFFKKQFTMPIENLIKFLFERFLKTYVKNQSINFNQFYKEGLKDIHLNEILLNEMLLQDSPFRIQKAVIDHVSSAINWQNILDKSAVIHVDGLNIYLSIDQFNQQQFLAKKYQRLREINSQTSNGLTQVIEEQDLEDSIKQSLKESLRNSSSSSSKGKKAKGDDMHEQVDAYKILVKKLLLGLKLSVSNLNVFIEIPSKSSDIKNQSSQKEQPKNQYAYMHLESFQLQQFHDKQEQKSFIKQALFSNFEVKAHGFQLYLTSNPLQPANNIESNECILCCGHEYEYNAQLNQYIPKQQIRVSLEKQNIQAILPRLEIMLDSKQLNILLYSINLIKVFKQEEQLMEQVFQNQQIQTEKNSQASKIQAPPPRMRVYSFDYQEMTNRNQKKGKLLELKKKKSSFKSKRNGTLEQENEFQQKQQGEQEYIKNNINQSSSCSSSSESDSDSEESSESERIIVERKQSNGKSDDGWSDIDFEIEEQDQVKVEIFQENEMQIIEEVNENSQMNNKQEQKIISQNNNNNTNEMKNPSQIMEEYFNQQLQKIQENKLNSQNDVSESDSSEISGIKNEQQQSDEDSQICKELFETLQFNDSQISEILESMRKNRTESKGKDNLLNLQSANTDNINNNNDENEINNDFENSILVKDEIQNQNIQTIKGIKQDSSHHFLFQSIHIYLVKQQQQYQQMNDSSHSNISRKWLFSQKRSGGEERILTQQKYNIYMNKRNYFQINIQGMNIVQYKDDGQSLHLYFKKMKMFDLNWIKGDLSPQNNHNDNLFNHSRPRKSSKDFIMCDHFCINQVFNISSSIQKKNTSIIKHIEKNYSIYKNRDNYTQIQSQSNICFNLLSNKLKNSILIEISNIYINGDYKTIHDLKNYFCDLEYDLGGQSGNTILYNEEQGKMKQNEQSQMYQIDAQKLQTHFKNGDYIKEEDRSKQQQQQQDGGNNENEQLKVASQKITLQIENMNIHYEILKNDLLNELKNINLNENQYHLNSSSCYCSSKLKSQRLSNKDPTLLLEINSIKTIQTTNEYQISSQDLQTISPFYKIQRNEICFNELILQMYQKDEKYQLIKILGDKNLSCDPFICIETLQKIDRTSQTLPNLTMNHQESYTSITQDNNYLNTPFNRMRQNSNLLLFSAQHDHKIKKSCKISGGTYFKKDDFYIFNVDENPINQEDNFKNINQNKNNNHKDDNIKNPLNSKFSTQILLSIPNIQVDLAKDNIENLIITVINLNQELQQSQLQNKQSDKNINIQQNNNSEHDEQQKEQQGNIENKTKLILNIFTNNLTISYHTSEKDEIGIEINSLQIKHDFYNNSFKYSIYDMIIVDTQQAKPLLGQPLRLVESSKILSKYRQHPVQDIILYKQGVYTQHQQFQLGKQPIRVNIHRILSTTNDEEKMNSSYYFTQRMIMIPKSHNLTSSSSQNPQDEEDKLDYADWMLKFKYNSTNDQYSLKLFGCIFRLTDFTLPFFDEISFLVENIHDMIKQFNSNNCIGEKEQQQFNINENNKCIESNQSQIQLEKNSEQQVQTKFNVIVKNSALDIFLFYNQNYLEKGGLSRMSYSQQVIDLELQKKSYYCNNRLCLLIPECQVTIEQDIKQIQTLNQINIKNNNNVNPQSVKVTGYLKQLSGQFLKFDDHNERVNSILLLDYSESIVLNTEESMIKQMNFKQIFNIHSIGIKAIIDDNQSQVLIETKGVQIMLCKDTLNYLMNFQHLLSYNLEILSDSQTRKNRIAEQYINSMQRKRNNENIKQQKKSNNLQFFNILEDEVEYQDSKIFEQSLSSLINDTDKEEINDKIIQNQDINEQKSKILQQQQQQKSKVIMQNKRLMTRGIFKTHCRQIHTQIEDDMNILEAEKSYFNQDDHKQNDINQFDQPIKFSFSLILDDFQLNVFKGLDFNSDISSSLENNKRNVQLVSNQIITNSSKIKNGNNNLNNNNNNNNGLSNQNDIRKVNKKLSLLPNNTFLSLKQSKMFNFIENYQPKYIKYEPKRMLQRIKKENSRDYQNRMLIIIKGASFKTEEYIQLENKKISDSLNHIKQINDENQNDNNNNSKKVYISIKKFEIIDELKDSSINKFLTMKKKKMQASQSQQSFSQQLQSSMIHHPIGNSNNSNQFYEIQENEIEYETGIDFMNLEINYLQQTSDYVRISGGLKIHPLQLYIHGVTLDFLIGFFDLKNEIQQALSGCNSNNNINNNNKKRKESLNKSPRTKKRKSKLNQNNNNNNKIQTRNEWEIVEGIDENSQNNNDNDLYEQYDGYESSSGASDEENKELVFDNNESLIQYYFQKNNIDHISPLKKGRGIFSGIDDINPFQLYKNKYSFETFDTKKQQQQNSQVNSSSQVQQNKDIPDSFNQTCIQFTSSKQNKMKSDDQEYNKQINNGVKEIKMMNRRVSNEIQRYQSEQLNSQENQIQINHNKNQNDNLVKDEEIEQGQLQHNDDEEEDDFDDELDNISFSSIQNPQSNKYRIEIDNFEVQETEITLDYDPRAIDLFQLMNDFKMEALNLSSIKGIQFQLPSLFISNKTFSNLMNIIQIAVNTYQKDILENQFSYLDIVQKVNLLKSTSKIFSNMIDIVTIPFERYSSKDTVVEGTLEGTKSIAKIISYQALDISSTILSTVNSTFHLFGVKSRPTRFLTKIIHSIKKQVEEEEEEEINNHDEKYKNHTIQD